MKRTAAVILAVAALALWAGAVMAGDIVTMPTANQVGAGDVDLAQYYIGYDYPPGWPDHVYFTTMYVGVTDRLEIDAIYADPDGGPGRTIWNATLLVLSERNGDEADVVVGVRDMSDTLNKMFPPGNGFEPGAFVAAAKTLNPPAGPPTPADCPIWRLHLGVGQELGLATDPNDMNGSGLFGGVQALVTPQVGAVALWDSTDHIVGLTYTPDPKGPTYKGGVFGDHWWIGINYTFQH
ncbi:MAG: hypothetical protein JSV65_00180 [Armatimonadota bacterium]|nr:MAG: hypothetical protein JSV65_00180 [Armatimonadota bacterium]